MRIVLLAALIAALPFSASAAPTWQTVSAEPGKRIELDRTSIKREEPGKVLATGRIILDKELSDAKTGAAYRVIEATTRYDCSSRNANTIKRVFKKNESEVLREEDIKGTDMPVRSGTLDDKVLREVCRPSKVDAKEVAQQANEAATKLKEANDALLKKEAAKAGPGAMVKTSEPPHAAPAKTEAAPVKPIPSILPPLQKPAPVAAAPAPAPAPAPVMAPAPRPAPVVQAPPVKAQVVSKKSRSTAADNGMHDAASAHAHIHWSYDGEGGPENWAKLDPKNTLCASGTRQSPIDIRDGIKVDLEPIQFDYKPSMFRIVDNGHTVQVTPSNGTITVSGKSYELLQFHFHKPSEEKINGRPFDMVAHLVHKSDDGQLAVVAVLLEKGAENPTIQTLWNNLPLEKKIEASPPSASVDLAAFLPGNRNYTTYMGSLTTPPCSEGVLWLVLRQPVQISPEQIAIFSRLYKNNARPVQPTWGRLIKENR